MTTTWKSVLIALLSVAAATVAPARAADPFTIPGTFVQQGIFTCTDFSMSGNGTIDSAGVNASGPTNRGTVRANGNITLSGTPTIDGDAIVGPGKHITVSGAAHITGTQTVATSTVPCTPIDLNAVKTAIQNNNDNARIPKSGKGNTVLNGTNLSMSGNDSLTIPAGTYYFTNISLSGSSAITLGASVRILVNGSVSISGGSFIGSGAYSNRFWISGGSVSLSNSTLKAFVYAPAGAVSLANSTIVGGIFSNSISISGGSHITRSIDDAQPQVAITSPADNSVAANPAAVLIKGTVSDAQTAVTVKVNGQTATVADDGTWQITLNLSSGTSPVTVTAVATDGAGNTASASIHVLTGTPPTITLTSPVPGSTVSTSVVNIAGSAGTATSVKVNGTTATIAGGNWSLAGFNLGADGPHTLTIIGTNGSGSSTISPVITSDVTPPVVTGVVTPSPNAAGWNKANATVSFTCTDATSGVNTCPGSVVVSTETASQVVSGTATDKAGNQKPASVTVKLDKTAPAVAISTPAGGTTVHSASLPVHGTVSDALSGVAGVTCNGTAASVSSGAFDCIVTLVAGDNTITATASDAAGNTQTSTIHATYTPDAQAPAIAITSPATGTYTKLSAVTVTGTATDDVSVSSVTVNGTNATLTNGTWTANITLTAGDGVKTITATATDSSGKSTPASVQITLDTTPPLVAITSPANGTSTISATMAVSGTVSDALSGVAAVTCNGTAATISGGTFTCSVPLVEGDNTITATATDIATNSAAAVTHVAYTPDAQAPTISITSPANGTFTKETTVTVSGTAHDDIAVAALTVNGQNVTVGEGGAWTTTVTLTGGDGAKTITAVATDSSGKSTPASIQITLDTTPPVIAIGSPANGTSTTSPTISVSGTVSDALSGVAGVSCNGTAATVSGGTFTCVVPLVAGDNGISATATDVAGNSANVTTHVTFTPDSQAPTIAITSPAGGTFTKVTTVPVTGTAGDDVGVANVTVNGSQVALTDGNWSATVTLSGPDGAKTITAVATDVSGKQTPASVQITLDTTPPVIAIGSPANGTSTTSQTITVNGTVSDALSGVAGVTCNGAAATLSGGTFTCSVTLVPGDNTITATATDVAGNTSSATSHATYTPDAQAPTIAITAPENGSFTKDIVVSVTGTAGDDVGVANVTVNGTPAAFTNGSWSTTVTLAPPDGAKTITAVATDVSGKQTPASVEIILDTTSPEVAVTSPAADARVVASNELTLSGTVSDALSGVAGVTCNGSAATVSGGTFTCHVTLLEGSNSVTIAATDRAGNAAQSPLAVQLDTRAPQLSITAPAANACTNGNALQVTGRATDPALGTIKLSLAPGTGSATVTPAADGSFTASIPLGAEGKYVLSVEAADSVGHTAVATIPITVDRTAPSVQVTVAGAPFANNALVNHAVALNVRVLDADAAATLSVTLGGQPYVSGTSISAEGSYALRATANDCAGNPGSASIDFRIDTTAPRIVTITPATGATVASASTPITGTVDADDLASLVAEGTAIAASISGRNFTINAPLAEGTNSFVLLATDLAGNSSRQSYSVTVKSTTPAVQILESGLPFPPNAFYNRPVTPVIRSNEPGATVTATLDNAPFTSGTAVTADGAHTVNATASDAFGHSASATASFTIDTTAPALTIQSPANDSTVSAATVEVRGTATGGDVARVTVNAGLATLATDGTFISTVALDLGPNTIVVTAFDRAGNSASVTLVVTRGDDRPGLVLSTPADGTVTNRRTITVGGQVLTPGLGAHVTINGTLDVVPDSTGGFRLDGVTLHEDDNPITAAIAGSNRTITVHVTADFTPPVLHVLANGTDMSPAMRFATSPAITTQATDNHPAGLKTTLTIDGVEVIGASPTLGDGGHALTAIARDAAGNVTRIDRTFSVGSTATGTLGGCTLGNFDPPNNAAVFSNAITFSGRAGGAAAVLVNSNRATLDSGSFATSLQLNNEGANTVTIACADANGVATTTDTPVTVTIYRYTQTPSITITDPHDQTPLGSTTVTVNGTVGADVVSGDVNGIAFTPANGAFSVPNVSLASGLNIITARGRNAAGRVGVATVRVIVANGAPQITITSPLPATQTGASSVDVTGVYTNVVPATIRVGGVTATTASTSDTTGTFAAVATLAPNAVTTITATGQNAGGIQATSTITVQQVSGPSVSITAPADNTTYRADATAPDTITGTIAAEGGSTVSVNGVAATMNGTQFSAVIPFQSSSITTVIARVTTPGGQSATDTIRLVKLPGALTVKQSFPEANAAAVDVGALIVVLFSNPLNGSTATGALTVADDTGHTISGVTFVDKDAVSFAPNVPLDAGRKYTFTVSTSLKDVGGQSLASPFVLEFHTATTAPAVAPTVNEGNQTGCFTSATITGTATNAGARVRLDLDGLTTTTIAGFNRTFSFTVSFSGQSGFHIARVREVGTDGTVSPERDVTYRINCAGPAVVAATLDRTAKTLAIQFSKAMNPATLTASPSGTIRLDAFSGTVAMNSANDVATVTYTGDLATSLTLTVTTGAQDANGVPLGGNYVQSFPLDTQQATGNGYITGAVYDASNGRPLQGATVVITPAANGTSTTDEHGRYTSSSLGEGAFSIEAGAAGFTKVWRQVVVPSGSGVVPIDIRLTKRGAEQASGNSLNLHHGGDTVVTRAADLLIPSAALSSGHQVALTAVGGQSLAGLLPLGWSPLASAEIEIDGSSLPQPIPSSKLTFTLSAADASAVSSANQTLSVVQYDNARDEWRTVVAVAPVVNNAVVADIQTSGNYALVYPDAAAALTKPAPARAGTALQGVANPCGDTPAVCRLVAQTFDLSPKSVTPSGRSTATLITLGSDKAYPSGTAVQAYIDEQLNLADGSVRIDPPFATDLLMYRAPAGDLASAIFHIAPTTQAAAVTLRDGVDHIRVVDYPGRIDRGTLIGSEGGRVPGDDTVSIDIPAGATTDALHATATPMSAADLSALAAIPGFHVAGGFTLALTRASDGPAVDLDGDGKPDVIPVTLLKPAKATLTVDLAKFATGNQQVILAELLDKSAYGPVVRLAATTSPATTSATNVKIVTTDAVTASLPVDGIIRDGRYLILTADAPIAFAWGQVRLGTATGPAVTNALVTATSLGVRDVTRAGGVFALPVPASVFTLTARTAATGSGAPASSAAAPAANEKVPFGVLVLAAQPPHLVSITPNNVEVPVSGFQAVATFDTDIDSASAANGIVVNNSTTGTTVAGTITTAGKVVTFTPAATLASGSSYTITVRPAILSVSGAPLGIGASASFTTPAAPPANSGINRAAIQITIPENGVSLIRGTAGALPVGAVALAVRRGTFFQTQYQVQVGGDGASDGSFHFSIGKTTGPDRVTTADQIDLQVQDGVSHSTIAVIPLTPFVTADGKGFIAPVGESTTFTTAAPLSVTVTVPAGAFDVPTLVTVAAAQKSDFSGVPSFDAELGYYGAMDVTFDGIAKKPLELEMPVPPGTDTANKTFALGRFGMSSLGPRVEIDDLVTVVNGKFTTRRTGASGQTVTKGRNAIGANNTLVGSDVRDYLIKTIKMGKYAWIDIRVPTGTPGSAIGWAALDGLQSNLDIFWDLYHSLYASEFYLVAGHGRIVVPVVSNSPFVVQGVDAATGIKMFEKAYDGIPPAAPGEVTGIPSLETNTSGPYPVSGDPFSIQTAEILAGLDAVKSVTGVTINTSWATTNDSGQTVLTLKNATVTDPPRHIQVLNVRSGELSVDSNSSVSIQTKIGDRLIVFTQSERVEPRADVSIVFNEPITIPPSALTDQDTFDMYMRTLFELQKNTATSPAPASFQKIDAQTHFLVDSGNRRVFVHADLQSGAEYRLHLSPDIADMYTGAGGPLKLGQAAGGQPLNGGIDLYFAVRKPKGDVGPWTALKHGSVRDLALDGNLLLVSAQDGGLYAFDASDPANLATTKFAWAQAPPSGAGESWTVLADQHGRIWTTALTGEFGVVRTFRTEDFIDKLAIDPGPGTDPQPVTPYAGGTVSWRTGITVGINSGVDTVLLSDRPEAIPRKLQIVTQDDKVELTVDKDFDTRLTQPNLLSVTGSFTGNLDDFRKYSLNVPTNAGAAGTPPTGYPYVSQRITVRNLTAGLRWSKDGKAGAAGASSVNFDTILVHVGDQIRIERNMLTYGVVSLFGYGIGVYDLNAIESNSRVAQGTQTSGTYRSLATMVDLTTAEETLTYSPEAIVMVNTDAPAGSPVSASLTAIAAMPATGFAVITVEPKTGVELNGQNAPSNAATFELTNSSVLLSIKKLVSNNGSRPFFGRFNSIARYDDGDGRTFALLSGGRYGIVVVDVTKPYAPQFVDVIWSPKGAWAVRTVGDHYATSLDSDGRTLLIDLSDIGNSGLAPIPTCLSCAPVFSILADSLAAGFVDLDTFGSDDPRIIWRGEKPVDPNNPLAGGFNTTLAAVADPETGMIFGGTLLKPWMRVQSGIDPRVSLKVNLGTGELTEVQSIVPLGIQPRKEISDQLEKLVPCTTSGLDIEQPTPCRENASQGVFRIEMTLPGALSNAVGGDVRVALESERIPGAPTEQSKAPLPRAHLRQNRPADASGATVPPEKRPVDFFLRRVIKDSYLSTPSLKYLRLQKGFNKFVSPWVIAIADPRAMSKYAWGTNDNREDAGCFQCTPPPFLVSNTNKTLDTDYFEIYTLGRNLTLRPEVTSSGGTTTIFDNAGNYKYLGDRHRIFARFGTVPADTVRPVSTLVAAQGVPVAMGTLMGTVYVHSGEIEASTIDFDAGGRAEWNVIFDRAYRSRTLGATPFGYGWDSAIYQRLRVLPTGDVELRDGGGDVWLFTLNDGRYTSPKGYNSRLIHTEQGWTIIDQKRRINYFDELGRVTRVTDEFYTPDGKGNVIRYAYDETGLLAAITDPIDRTTKIAYYDDADHEGLIKSVTDWRSSAYQRKVTYDFDAGARLTSVHLPQFTTAGGSSVSPERKYAYDTGKTSTTKDSLELSTNLLSVTHPAEALQGGTPAITYTYGPTPYDYVSGERWATGESASYIFTPSSTPAATVTDVLGQRRTYVLKLPTPPARKLDWYSQERAHIDTLNEESVEVSTAPYGSLPSSVPTPGQPSITTINRETKYVWNPDETLASRTLKNGNSTTYGYASGGPTSDYGQAVNSVTRAKLAGGQPTSKKTATDMAVPDTLTLEYGLRSGTAFLNDIKANGKKIEQHEPERNTLTPTDTNSTTTQSEFDGESGQPTKVASSGGNASCSSGACGGTTTLHYPQTQPSELFKRGLPDYAAEGQNETLKTTYKYENEQKASATDSRNVTTTSEYDSWQRPIRVTTTGPGQTLVEEFDYDANGHLHKHRRRQNGAFIETTYDHDSIGRKTRVTVDHMAAEGSANVTLEERDDYSGFASGTLVHTSAKGAQTTTTIDKLGRAKRAVTPVGGGSPDITTVTSYDIANNPVYTSDTLRYAMAMAYDSNGRRTDTQRTDGSREHLEYDGFGRMTTFQQLDASGNVVYARTSTAQPDGQVSQLTESGGSGPGRITTRAWDGAGRTGGVSVAGGDAPRAALREHDDSGRLQKSTAGAGTMQTLTNSFTETSYSQYESSYLASLIKRIEKKAPPSSPAQSTETHLSDFDTLGNAKDVSTGNLNWKQSFDEAGHVASASAPGRPPAGFSHDAHGKVTQQTLPDQTTQSFDFDKSGALKGFTDPANEVTSKQTDLVGRPTLVTYADGTTQRVVYEGISVLASKDRQDRWLSYVNENGHLTQVWNGQTPGTGTQLDRIDYDAAGRVTAWTTPDAKVTYQDFTLDGLPQRTTQTRYRNHKGLQNPDAGDLLDTFTQTHGYNGHGERLTFDLPGGGGNFASTVTQHYDAMGNLDSLTTNKGFSMASTYRATGRPNERRITLPNGRILLRTYDYDATTGLLAEMKATVSDPASGKSFEVGGSRVGYDGLQVNDVQLLGVSSNQRHTRYSYDSRSRVAGAIVAATGDALPPPPNTAPSAPGSSSEFNDAADFRTGQGRAALLDSATQARLQQKGVNVSAIDPPGATMAPATGHKIATVTHGEQPAVTFNYGGKAERVEDGQFHYHYDQKGRLEWVSELATASGQTIRRILYAYDGRNRLVGRTAQAASQVTTPVTDYGALTWNLETRSNVIALDGMPAETTFVWDPISDRLIAVMRTGASKIPNDPNGDVLKQIVHGDMAYDDPVEVTTIDTSALVGPSQAPPVTQLYPIYDEAASRTLQIVVNRNGEVVARSLNNDPFGGAELDLAGAAVDNVTVKATKDAQGDLQSVVVTMRATEQLASGTVTGGTRLAAVDASGKLVRATEAEPVLADAYTVQWTLTPEQWSTLSNPAAVTVGGEQRTPASLSVAATPALRAAVWAVDIPILPAPEWLTVAKPVYTSDAFPVEVREPLSGVASLIASAQAGETKSSTPYDIPNLGVLASDGSASVDMLMAATFQAQPFAEPFTRKFYVRERWYDPLTGTWLTPDPLGYKDSSNPYAYCGGDPINCSDPTGMARKTKNGGSNWLGDLGDVVKVTGFWSGVASTALDTLGNTVSDLLGLDIVADAAIVAGDSTRSPKERAIAAAKGTAIAVLDVAGGQILKGAGGLLSKVPGVAGVVEKFAASGAAKALTKLAGTEIESLAVVDEVAAAIKTSRLGQFLRRDVETFLPGGMSPAEETARLAGKADDLHAVLEEKWEKTRRTSGVMSTRGGPDISAGGGVNLNKAQRALAEARGDLVATLTNRRIEIVNEMLGANLPAEAHAEVTAYYKAMTNNLKPRAMSVTPAKFCPEQCRTWVPSLGADLLSDYTAYWFSPVPLSNYIPLGGIFGDH
jgi:RHS repeat-associated protein